MSNDPTEAEDEAESEAGAGAGAESEAEPEAAPARRKRRQTAAQTMGGVLFGFEQQIWRTAPPPQELVHHARPDAPVPAKDGTRFTIELPVDDPDAAR